MALLLIEGFDTYATGGYTDKWNLQSGTIQAGGRKGTKALWHWDAMNANASFDNKSTLILGYALKVNATGTWELMTFRDGSTVQMRLDTDGANQIVVKRGSTIISYTGYTIAPNTWIYLEFKATFHNSNGSYELRVNNIPIDSQSGIDTSTTGSSSANSVFLNMREPGKNSWIDDVYMFDDEGAFCNDFVGDVHVEALFPDGAGYVSDWAAFPGAGANYEEVDEIDPDDDTTFVATSGVLLEDSYTFGDLVTLSGLVYAVQVNLWAKKDDVGSRTIVGTARPISTVYSGIGVSLGDSYGYTTYPFDANPETSGLWTIAEINAAEFGVREEA